MATAISSALSDRSVRALLSLILLATLAACALYASVDLSSGRVWDERYQVRNVERILRAGTFRPSPYYPSFSYLPQAALLWGVEGLHRLTGAESLAVLAPGEGLTATGYLVARLSCAVLGLGSLVLTFLLGRRLFSPEVGLLATLLLAATPVYIRGVSVFKPEASLLLFVLLTFWAGLGVAREGTRRAYLLGGLGVGLAASSKQIGALASLPLVVATLLSFRRLSRWLRLALAGLVSIGVFLLFHPFLDLLPRYLSRVRPYLVWASRQQQLQAEDMSGPGFLPRLLLQDSFHGPLLGAVALLGLGGLLVRAYRRRAERDEAAALLLLVTFPIGFALICATLSDYHRQSAFLALVPFTSLAAAWLLYEGWLWIASRVGRPVRRLVLWPALVVLAALTVRPAAAFVYSGLVPETTLDRAGRIVLGSAPSLKHLSVVAERGERGVEGVRKWQLEKRGISVLARRVGALTSVPQESLDLADYEIFNAEKLEGREREFYEGRRNRVPAGAVVVVEPELFRWRGARRIVLSHPWRRVEPALPVELREPAVTRPRLWRGELPEEAFSGGPISLDLRLPVKRAGDCTLDLGESRMGLFRYRRRGREAWWMTERFEPEASDLRLECRGRADLAAAVARVLRWERSSAPS